MKVKVAEATGITLGWMVAKAAGEPEETLDPWTWEFTAYPTGCYDCSTSWAVGGPIIEREKIDFYHQREADLSVTWCASYSPDDVESTGPTPLIAAMRCFVVSKLGDEVEVPDELCV